MATMPWRMIPKTVGPVSFVVGKPIIFVRLLVREYIPGMDTRMKTRPTTTERSHLTEFVSV
jgi:hypothetical protein